MIFRSTISPPSSSVINADSIYHLLLYSISNSIVLHFNGDIILSSAMFYT